MKIRLLNKDGYSSLHLVNFPVEVEATVTKNGFASLAVGELYRIGRLEGGDDEDDTVLPLSPSSWEEV